MKIPYWLIKEVLQYLTIRQDKEYLLALQCMNVGDYDDERKHHERAMEIQKLIDLFKEGKVAE